MSSIATSYMQANNNPDLDPRFENIPPDAVNNPLDGKKKFRLHLSQRLHSTSILAFISYLILLIAFASPYWLASYKFTDSAFKRLGLWDFCFQDYRHPAYQYDYKFSGCHWIYSQTYTNIRDWLQPSWFMFVQATTTIALCLETLGLMLISIIFMHFLIQYQLIILCLAMVFHLFTTLSLAFALLTFILKAFDRSWIMYPDFNHLDWAYYFALVSMVCNGLVTYFYYLEAKDLKFRMLKMKRLIVATSMNGSRQFPANDIDSLDAVYASRSVYNQGSLNQQLDNGQRSFKMQGDLNPGSNSKDASLMYPHFTQV